METNTLTSRSYKSAQLPALNAILTTLGLASKFSGEAVLRGADPILRSPHRLGEATSLALFAEAISAACIWEMRSKQVARFDLQILDAIHSLHSTHFLKQNGYSLSVGAEYIPTNGLFRCKDGRFLMIESGPPYVKLERGYLNFFDCGNNRESIAKRISQFDSAELQEKLSELGYPACIAYTPEEWRQHPQGKILSTTPLVEIEKIADGRPSGLIGPAEYPLSGIKVLDFTHVLAGPRSARSLANYGADVLHISSPYHRDTVSQNLLVNMGKRSAYLLLTEANDLNRFKKLAAEADVLTCSYRTSVAERFGITPAEIAKSNPNGIVYASINAYGHDGPWKLRPGFDQNGQTATGICAREGSVDQPQFSPVFYLNDFLTGYLAAAGISAALYRRATEGGSYNVKLSLARTAMWVQDLGYIEAAEYASMPAKDEYPVKFQTVDTTCGKISELAPAIEFTGMPTKRLDMLHPFGADLAEW